MGRQHARPMCQPGADSCEQKAMVMGVGGIARCLAGILERDGLACRPSIGAPPGPGPVTGESAAPALWAGLAMWNSLKQRGLPTFLMRFPTLPQNRRHPQVLQHKVA